MVGIVVDQVNQVTTFADIQPPPERIGSVQGSYFTGIGSTDTGLVSVLKLDNVLNDWWSNGSNSQANAAQTMNELFMELSTAINSVARDAGQAS